MTGQLQSLHIDRAPVAQVVYDAIRTAIVDKTLAPGAAISEAGLARDLNVSKTPVREALLRLREIQLVEADAHRQLVVVKPSLETISSAYEARRALEGEASALAAARGTGAALRLLRDAADESVRAAEAREVARFRDLDRQFHSAVAEAALSPYLTRLIKNSLLLTGTMRARDVPITGDSVGCAREHLTIAEAIGDQDVAKARRSAVEHVDRVARSVLAAAKDAGQGIW